jgi:hypothetical protein
MACLYTVCPHGCAAVVAEMQKPTSAPGRIFIKSPSPWPRNAIPRASSALMRRGWE